METRKLALLATAHARDPIRREQYGRRVGSRGRGGRGEVGVTTWPHTFGLCCLPNDRNVNVKHQASNNCGIHKNKKNEEKDLFSFLYLRSVSLVRDAALAIPGDVVRGEGSSGQDD